MTCTRSSSSRSSACRRRTASYRLRTTTVEPKVLRTWPALLLLLAGCSTPMATQTPAASPHPDAIAVRSPSPTTPKFTLHCNLPVDDRGGGSGFLTFPGGDFTAAGTPRATIPEIGGYYTQTYDWAHSKWLPV